MSSTLQPGNLFSVKGLVALITGGGSGKDRIDKLSLIPQSTFSYMPIFL